MNTFNYIIFALTFLSTACKQHNPFELRRCPQDIKDSFARGLLGTATLSDKRKAALYYYNIKNCAHYSHEIYCNKSLGNRILNSYNMYLSRVKNTKKEEDLYEQVLQEVEFAQRSRFLLTDEQNEKIDTLWTKINKGKDSAYWNQLKQEAKSKYLGNPKELRKEMNKICAAKSRLQQKEQRTLLMDLLTLLEEIKSGSFYNGLEFWLEDLPHFKRHHSDILEDCSFQGSDQIPLDDNFSLL